MALTAVAATQATNLLATNIYNAANAYLGVGNGNAAATTAQTDLQGATKFRKKVDSGYPVINGSQITYKATFENAEANFDWNEWGVFDAASGGNMLVRVVEVNGTKLNTQKWTLEVVVTIGAKV